MIITKQRCLRRIIFIDNNMNNTKLLLLFHYQKYLTFDSIIIIIPPHLRLSCFNGITISIVQSSISSGLITSSTSFKYALAKGSLAKEGYASSKVLVSNSS